MLTHTVFPSAWGWLSLEGQMLPPPRSLSAAPQWALWSGQRGQLFPLRKGIYKYSVCWCNWHKTQTAPWVSNFSFHTSTFEMTTSRITRNSSKFLALGVPMIPAGMQKRLSFPPENNVLPRHCPNTSNEANERFVLNNLWKDCPLSDRAPGFSYNIYKMSVSKET